jgi:hypothetical protein
VSAEFLQPISRRGFEMAVKKKAKTAKSATKKTAKKAAKKK